MSDILGSAVETPRFRSPTCVWCRSRPPQTLQHCSASPWFCVVGDREWSVARRDQRWQKLWIRVSAVFIPVNPLTKFGFRAFDSTRATQIQRCTQTCWALLKIVFLFLFFFDDWRSSAVPNIAFSSRSGSAENCFGHQEGRLYSVTVQTVGYVAECGIFRFGFGFTAFRSVPVKLRTIKTTVHTGWNQF